jgi:SAM-dependent methyltransferase
MTNNQEQQFASQESDAWFNRNKLIIINPADPTHPVITCLDELQLKTKGSMVDLGGGTGKVAAAFIEKFENWDATVIELSGQAVTAGKAAFPSLSFTEGSVTDEKLLRLGSYDVVLITGVFSWIDRSRLSRVVSNADQLLNDNGFLVIYDFYSPYQRANKYNYSDGIYTYKQDYSLPFLALGTYSTRPTKRWHEDSTSTADQDDPYDKCWTLCVLQKDLFGRYSYQKE